MCFLSAGESGSADTVRDPRGFAVKFYTEEGNWDLTGNNTPIFFIRDALLVSVRRKNFTVCAIMTQVARQTCHSYVLCSSRPSSTRRSGTPKPTWKTLTWCGTSGAWGRRVCIRYLLPAAQRAYKPSARRRDMFLMKIKSQWLHISCSHLHECHCVPIQRHTGFFKIVVTMTVSLLCVSNIVCLSAGVFLVQRSRIAWWLPPHEWLRLPHL